jgi:hypothetical protein
LDSQYEFQPRVGHRERPGYFVRRRLGTHHFDTSTIGIAAFGSFGGYVQIPYAGAATRTTTIRLYVDGQWIASRDVAYPVL